MRGQIGDLLPLILLIFLVAGGGYAITQVLGQLNSLSQTLKTMKSEIIISLILLALISYIWKTKEANNVTLFIAFMCVLYMVYKIMYTPAIIFGSDGYIISPPTGIKPVTQTILSVTNKGKTVSFVQLSGERDCLIETSTISSKHPKLLCFYWEYSPSSSYNSIKQKLLNQSMITTPFIPVFANIYIYIIEYQAKLKIVKAVGKKLAWPDTVPSKVLNKEIYVCTIVSTGGGLFGKQIQGFKCKEYKMIGYPEYSASISISKILSKELYYQVTITAPFTVSISGGTWYEQYAPSKYIKKTKAEIYLKKYYVTTQDGQYVYHLRFGVLCTPNVQFIVKFYNSMFSVTRMRGGVEYCDGYIHYINITLPTNEPYTGFTIVMKVGAVVVNKVSKTFTLPKLPIQHRKPIKVNNSQQKQKLISICKNNSLKTPVKVANHIYTISKEFRITKDYHFITYIDTNDYTNLSYILLCNGVSTPYFVLNTNKNNAVNCTSKVCSFLVDVQLPNISRNNTCELYAFKNGKTIIKETYTFKLNITKQQQQSYKPDYSNQNINYPTSTYKKIFQIKMYFYYIMILIGFALIVYMMRRR